VEFPAVDAGVESLGRRWQRVCTVVMKPVEQKPLTALRVAN